MWAIVAACGSWLVALVDQVQLIRGAYLSITALLVWILRRALVKFLKWLFWFLWWGTRSKFKVIWIKTEPAVVCLRMESLRIVLAKITDNSRTSPLLNTAQPALADEALAWLRWLWACSRSLLLCGWNNVKSLYDWEAILFYCPLGISGVLRIIARLSGLSLTELIELTFFFQFNLFHMKSTVINRQGHILFQLKSFLSGTAL